MSTSMSDQEPWFFTLHNDPITSPVRIGKGDPEPQEGDYWSKSETELLILRNGKWEPAPDEDPYW